MENKESFTFTYSAAQRQEVENIRKKYLPDGEDKLQTLRRLDRSASQKAQAWAMTLGVIGTLVLGAGMSLFMSDLGKSLGLQGHLGLILGIALGLLGLVLVALAYPVYNRILEREKRRLAPQILRLTDELMK